LDIVVCIKPVCLSPVKFELADDRIRPGTSSLSLNESDEYALEQALVMKAQLGGTVTAITVGGLVFQDGLYVAKAKGVDRAIRVDGDYVDPLSVSELLARVIGTFHFDVILTGLESFDSMSGQTGACLAEKLHLPLAYAVTEIDAKAAGTGKVRIKKELGGGVYQVADVKLPGVFSVQSGIQPLKFTPPAKLIRARKEALECISLEDLEGLDVSAVGPQGMKAVELFKPETTTQVEMLQGETHQVASLLVKKIMEAS
jgi:electron transfer flavoprotein beta subunit